MATPPEPPATSPEKTASKDSPAMSTRPNTTKRDFVFHVGLIVFVSLYFASLLWWFGGIAMVGGATAHAAMAVVLPIVVVIGAVALFTLSSVALEGRRGERARSSPPSKPASEAPAAAAETKDDDKA